MIYLLQSGGNQQRLQFGEKKVSCKANRDFESRPLSKYENKKYMDGEVKKFMPLRKIHFSRKCRRIQIWIWIAY